MKKSIFYLLIFALFIGVYSCKDKDNDDYRTYTVNIELAYPSGSELSAVEGIEVSLYNSSTSASYTSSTNAAGVASFVVPSGVYEASATDKRSVDGTVFILNGIKNNITVNDTWDETAKVAISLTESTVNQIVIKELYVGGCQKDDGSGAFIYDKYVILYNNSDVTATLDKMCLAMTTPLTSTTSNADYVNDALLYESQGWIPAGYGIWYFTNSVSLEPGKQAVIALTNAIDNTKLYSNSVNLDKVEYYCTYDIEKLSLALWYPTPINIPTSHHLKVHFYGAGTAWPIHVDAPAFFVFSSKDTDLESFINNESNTNYYNNNTSGASTRKKIPVEWIVDAVEVFKGDATNNMKRLTKSVDAGYVDHIKNQGYTLYRNVDVEATKAIEGNEAKLVYGYSLGTTTTDPSGIDAEASIKNGARIIYKDTNNSSNDFHQRGKASLRD